MFKKKNKKHEEVVEQVKEDIIEPVKKAKVTPKVNERISPLAFFEMNKKKEPEVEEEPEVKQKSDKEKNDEPNDEVITVIVGAEDPWIWANTEEYEEKLAKESKKKRKKRGKKDEIIEEPEDKKDLKVFFEDDKGKNKKLNKKDITNVKEKKERKGKSNRKGKRAQLEEDIKNQKVFRYDGKKYTKVEDFITYLNAHYLDIEVIAQEILDNENFFGWVNKNSGMFATSLKEYKDIQAKIEK